MVVDKVVTLPALQVAISSVPIGAGKAVVFTVKAMVDFPLILPMMWISVVRQKETPTKGTKNAAIPKERNSVAMNSNDTTARKEKLKQKNSVKQTLAIKKQKQKKPWMPIGLMNLVSDTRSQRKKNSTNQTMALQKPLTCVHGMTHWMGQLLSMMHLKSTFFLFLLAHPEKFKEHTLEHPQLFFLTQV